MKSSFKKRNKMPAQPITQRIEGTFHRFIANFQETGGINHALSKGESREQPLREFFASLLPSQFGVTSGEVIDQNGNVSPQSDLIIYRKMDGIPILNDQPTIIQVESVICITEVKSKISVEEYKDCLLKAKKIHTLKPFNNPLECYQVGRQPTNIECRIFISVFAYGTDIKGTLKDECKRYIDAARELNIEANFIDRIYILGKGIINPCDQMIAEDTEVRKVGLFYFYSNLLQFAMREVARRKEVPYIQYFGKMSDGWKNI